MQMRPGRPVIIQFSKYDGTPHWRHTGTYLGQDEFGHWIGAPAGETVTKPTHQFTPHVSWVSCFPLDAWHVLTSNEYDAASVNEGFTRNHHYVDVSTVPQWDEPEGATGPLRVQMVDLDLDVIRRFNNELLIDDEDEFTEHQVAMAYSTEIIEAAVAEAKRIYMLMDEPSAEPYISVADNWISHWLQMQAELAAGAQVDIAAAAVDQTTKNTALHLDSGQPVTPTKALEL